MTSKVGIGIEAQFDASGVERQINQLGQKIAQANKVQFSPISVKSAAEVEKLIKQFEQLRKIHGDLNKRMNATGQGGASMLNLDWDKLYADPNSRARQMRKAFEYTTGASFQGGVAPPGPSPRQPGGGNNAPAGGGGGGWTGVAVGAAQAGMRAAGPVGGVAAGAMGTGVSAGFGAGLMGLVGGIVALGVGKLVSAATENIDKAQNNSMALDTLKRALGDVNVEFGALKSVVKASANNLSITYDEAGRLATQFAKLGNVSSSEFSTLGGEVETGVGMSRAFGMDPSQGVGVMGQMRGIGVTSSTIESKRFALLIGETIGKSDAFAKSGEVMEAIAGYAISQTRQNMGDANVAGFAGMFSALVGSKMPGMDPTGAAQLMGRVNSNLAAGGAKGEASQYFTGMVGESMGLSPYETKVLREGGMHSTKTTAFGKNSAYARYMGEEGQGGNQDLYSASRDMVERLYPGNTKQQKLQRADAFANHTGVSMTNAMGLLSVNSNAMGEMQKYADVGTLSANGIGNLTKVVTGTDKDRQEVASSLKARKEVNGEQRVEIDKAMASGNLELQKQVLGKLTAQFDQEQTAGTIARDQKNAIDNIKTDIADKLVPYVNDMRAGILWMAGDRKKTASDVLGEIAGKESEVRAGRIQSEAAAERSRLNKVYLEKSREVAPDPVPMAIQNQGWWKEAAGKIKNGTITPDEKKAFEERVTKYEADRVKGLTDPEVARKKRELEESKRAALKAVDETEKDRLANEVVRLHKELEAVKKADEARLQIKDAESGIPTTGEAPAGASGTGGAPGGGKTFKSPGRSVASTGAGAGGDALASSLDEIKDPTQRKNLASFLDAIAASEGANYNTLVGQGTNNKSITDLGKHPNIVGMTTADGPSTAAGRYQITNRTWKSLSHGGNSDFSPKSQDSAAIELLRRRGALRDVLDGNTEAAVGKLGSEWQSLPSGTSPNQGKRSWTQFNNYLDEAKKKNGYDTPVPEDVARKSEEKSNQSRIIFDPLDVIHRNERGEEISRQKLSGRLGPAQPSGTESYA